MAVEYMSRNFSKVKVHFQECKRVFPAYRENIKASLDIVEEINMFIREHCELSGTDQRELDEIRRDVRIYGSRIEKMNQKLQLASRSINTATSPVEMDAWCNFFLDWFSERAEFHKEFRIAERKWNEIEQAILESKEEV